MASDALAWCRRCERHGILPDVVSQVYDKLMKKYRGRWSKKIEAEATVKAVTAMRRIKANPGRTHLSRRQNGKD